MHATIDDVERTIKGLKNSRAVTTKFHECV